MYNIFEKLLKERGIKAVEVSKATGIPQSTFSDWKKGKSEPKKEKIKKLADFFDVPITFFYDDNIVVEIELVEALKDRQQDRLIEYAVRTAAAHRESGVDLSEEEIKKIDDYIGLLLAAKKNKK